MTDEDLDRLKEAANNGTNPVKYIAIDPGKANGVCGYDSRFYLQFMFTIPEESMIDLLRVFEKVDTCIIEDYRLFPDKSKDQVYSDMLTSRIIGRVETWAQIGKIRLVKQGSKIKNTGYKWIGRKPLPKSNPRNHSLDAHVHFMYWAITTSKIAPETLLSLVRKNA